MTRKPLPQALLSRLRHRGQWSEADARIVVEEHELSGTSVLAFAKAHELSASKVYHWRKLLDIGQTQATKEPKTTELTFAPVVVTGLGRPPALSLRIGALEVDIYEPAQVEPGWLAQLCAAASSETD